MTSLKKFINDNELAPYDDLKADYYRLLQEVRATDN
jgi:hypothetical protein